MTAPVYLHVWKAWLTAAGRDSYEIEWREDMRLAELVPEQMRGASGLKVFINRKIARLDARPSIGDHIDVAIMPTADPVTFGVVGAFLINAGITLAINLILTLLIGHPKGPKARGDKDSDHASWTGVQNTRVEGQPRQVVYGSFRVAPMILDEFVVTVSSPPRSTLYTIGAIGEGEVYRIAGQLVDTDTPKSTEDPDNPVPSGVQINGNELVSFHNVQLDVRMGTSDQTPITGFEQLVTDYEVGATLKQTESASANATLTLNPLLDLSSVLYNSNSAGAQTVWDAFGFGYDLRERADSFTALITFPAGLARVDSSSNLVNAGFQCLMRYRELDDRGEPYEVGGDNSDGWVYVYPEDMLVANTSQPFSREYSAPFKDPVTWSPGVIGRCLLFDGVSGYATTDLGANDSIPQQPATWVAGGSPDAISILGWCRFDFLPASGGSDYRPIVEMSYAGTPLRGLGMFLQRRAYGAVNRWVPTVYLGNGTTVSVHYPNEFDGHIIPNAYIPSGGLTSWHHIALTHKRVDASTSRVSMYLDGRLAFSYSSSVGAMRWMSAGKALEMGRSRTFQSGSYSQVRTDEFRVRELELTATEIATDYVAGIGAYGVHVTGHIAGWHFDENVGVLTMQDYGHYNGVSSPNDLRLVGSAVTGSQGSGHVISPGSGTAKRSRYRVEVVRLNYMSSNEFVTDESVWSIVDGKIAAQLAYPNTALIATKIKATDQLSGSRPTITVLTDGVLCPVWDGNSTSDPSITYQWTKNPAWICLDVATKKRYGAGASYDFFTVNLPSVKELADYCDELVYDNRGRRQVINETGTTSEVIDLRYDSTLFDSFGGIEILYRTSPAVARPTRRWTVGRFVGFTDIPAPTGAYVVDINTSNISGFEIGSVEYSGGGWIVAVKFDKATYGDPWTDGQFLSTYIALSGLVEGRERRFEYSWVHDTFEGVWETLMKIAGTARAMPFRDGKILRFKIEKPRTPVGIIGMGQIKPGTFQMDYVGSANRPNSYSCDYWDEDKDYVRANTDFDDPELGPETEEEDILRASVTIEGVTRLSQIKRDLFFRVLVNRILARSGKFETGLEALAFEVGDVFQLSHDIVPWGKSGRLLAASTTTALHVDRQIILQSGKTYYARVRSGGQTIALDGTITDHYETVLVTATAGTYASGAAISINALATSPSKDDPYVIYSTDEIVEVQCTSISLTEGMGREIEWIEHDEAIYDCDDLPEDLVI